LSPRFGIHRGSISGRASCQKRGCRNRHNSPTIRTFASLRPTLSGNLQSASTGAVESIVTVIGLARISCLSLRPPQSDLGSGLWPVQPVGTASLNVDFLAAPATYASHGKNPELTIHFEGVVVRRSEKALAESVYFACATGTAPRTAPRSKCSTG